MEDFCPYIFSLMFSINLISAGNHSSSIISRFNASCGVSPFSIFPPGNSQLSLNSPYHRWVDKITVCPLSFIDFITAATTLIIFIHFSFFHMFMNLQYTKIMFSFIISYYGQICNPKIMKWT